MKKLIIILALFSFSPSAKADFWGADIPILLKILTQATMQVQNLTQILGQARETVGILQEMNRGVKEVLRLAETAHVKLPPQVYESAKKIDQATEMAEKAYGIINSKAPVFTKRNFKSGVEGLFLSQDSLDYSTLLDQQGNQIKAASIVANQATATRLAAQTLGVLIHAVSHTNRIEAKQLELESSKQIQETAKENSEYESFVETHKSIEFEIKNRGFSSLNDISKGRD